MGQMGVRYPKLGFKWQEFITFQQKKDAASIAETPLLLKEQSLLTAATRLLHLAL